MAELSEPDKERIIILLARFKRPAEVVAIMADEWGVETNIDQVTTYNPQHPRFRADRDKWEPIFTAAREAYISDVKTIPIANQGYRLNELGEMFERAKKQKNFKLAAELAEQAAREVGGVLTNSRELNINDGRKARDLDSEDRKMLLGSIIAEAVEARKQKEQGQQPTKH